MEKLFELIKDWRARSFTFRQVAKAEKHDKEMYLSNADIFEFCADTLENLLKEEENG